MQKDMVGCGERLLLSKCLSSRFSHPISPPPSPAPGQACPARPPQCSSDAGGRHGGRRTEPASTQEVHCILQKVRRRRPKSHSTHVLSKSYSSQGVHVLLSSFLLLPLLFRSPPSLQQMWPSSLCPVCGEASQPICVNADCHPSAREGKLTANQHPHHCQVRCCSQQLMLQLKWPFSTP